MRRRHHEIDDPVKVSLAGLPPGWDVYLFRYAPDAIPAGRTEHAPPRLFPHPYHPSRGSGPDMWAHLDEASPTKDPYYAGELAIAIDRVDPQSQLSSAGIAAGDLVVGLGGKRLTKNLHVVGVDPRGRAASQGVRPLDWLWLLNGDSVVWELDTNHPILRLRAGAGQTATFVRSNDDESSVTWTSSRGLREDLGVTLEPIDAAVASAPWPKGTSLQILGKGGLETIAPAESRPSGIHGRITNYPLWGSRDCNHLGATPLADLWLSPGSYMVLLRRGGRADVRLPILVAPGEETIAPTAPHADVEPLEGFVYIAPGPYVSGGDPDATNPQPRRSRPLDEYWIGITEVSTDEYLEFLNDPEILRKTVEWNERADVQRSKGEIHVPRSVEKEQLPRTEQFWSREGADGRYVASWDRRLPVHGVSWQDGMDYCAWRTARAAREGQPWTFALPTSFELEKAARGVDGRLFPWGDEWFEGFTRCDLVVPQTQVRVESRIAFRGRHLDDESPFGIRDAAGNLLEYCSTFFEIDHQHCVWRGGHCVDRGPQRFRSASYAEGRLNGPSYHDGFRVVARR
jgi:formylglycine-generating enzyme required for sulfatase activity